MTDPSPTAAPGVESSANLARTLLRVAWMSIVLGMVVQGVVIAILRFMPGTVVADVAGKITWSVVVCTAVALASVASKAAPAAVGLMGLLAAPVAVAAARTIQKAVAGGMSGSAAASAVAAPAPGPWEMAIAKAVQYAVFGWLICRAQKRGTLKAHLAVSVPIGVGFAVYLAWRTWMTTDPAAFKAVPVIAKCVGDVAATVGCSVVLWAGVALAVKKG